MSAARLDGSTLVVLAPIEAKLTAGGFQCGDIPPARITLTPEQDGGPYHTPELVEVRARTVVVFVQFFGSGGADYSVPLAQVQL